MPEDLDLVVTDGVYALAPPTEDPAVRLRNRWTVQFLSSLRLSRGCILLSELEADRVKTNGDVVGLHAVSGGVIISSMRRLAQDIAPVSARILEFSFLDAQTLWIRDQITATNGTVIEAEFIVEAEA